MPENWACLLRGVNVGGTGKLPMAAFRELLEGIGAEQVATHIQSGNAVFRSDLPREDLRAAISAALKAEHGLDRAVFLLTGPELAAVLEGHPFGKADPAKVQAVLLAEPAGALDREAVQALAAPDEAWHLTDTAFYLSAPSGIGRSALAARIDRLLKVPTTTRNLRSLSAIGGLLRAL